jgi:CBS domain containing-hemolysin-like protein
MATVVDIGIAETKDRQITEDEIREIAAIISQPKGELKLGLTAITVASLAPTNLYIKTLASKPLFPVYVCCVLLLYYTGLALVLLDMFPHQTARVRIAGKFLRVFIFLLMIVVAIGIVIYFICAILAKIKGDSTEYRQLFLEA